MKNSIRKLLAAALIAVSATANLFAGGSSGEVDFARFVEAAKAEPKVDVNVGQLLISLAAKLVDQQESDTAKLLNSLHLVRVNVFEVSDDNRKGLQKSLQELHGQLDKQGWQRVVTVKDHPGQEVRVCLKTRGSDAVEGLLVSVLDNSGELVLVNIVGDLKPEQVAAVGKALNIEPVEKAGDAIKK